MNVSEQLGTITSTGWDDYVHGKGKFYIHIANFTHHRGEAHVGFRDEL